MKMRMAIRRSLATSLAMLAAACSGAEPPPPSRVEVVRADMHDLSPPLRVMAKTVRYKEAERGKEAEPVRPLPHLRERIAERLAERPEAIVDPVVQRSLGEGLIPGTLTNFEGQGTGLPGFEVQAAPPDTNGDIGPGHYVQTVNLATTIFSRQGNVVFGPVPTRTFWVGFPGACGTTNDGDPTVRYDRISDRWIIAQFSVSDNGPFYQCIAVSQSGDPTGAYHRYQFSYTAFNDYPKFAVWPDAYYVTFNMFTTGFIGGKACAFDRSRMISGLTATMQCFDTGNQFGGLLASDLDGPTPPPAGSPNYHVALDTETTLAFWKFKVDFATPGSSTFIGPTIIPVAAFTPACFSACVPQPGTTQRLDAIADRLMNRLAYRNFGTHESLVSSHSVAAGTGAGVRFFELRMPGTTPTVFQQGTFAPDGAHRWMSSIAMDSAGNMALGYTVSSSTINPSVRYTGRLAGDPPGTMPQGEGTIVDGTGSQTGGLSRWGDYSSMTVDPLDDCTFWYTQEYMGASGSFNWRTRIASFKFPDCGSAPNDFSLTPVPTSQTVTAGQSVTYTINTAVTAGVAQTVNLNVVGLPTGVTGSFNPPTITSGQSSTLTVNTVSTAANGTTRFTLVGNGTFITRAAAATITVTGSNTAPTIQITSPVNGSAVSGNVTITADAMDPDGTVAGVQFDLPDGTSVVDTSAPYSATWNSATVPDGGGRVIRATVTDDRGAAVQATTTVVVQNAPGDCVGGTFNAADVPIAIPDNNSTGITSTIPVVGRGNIATLKLSLNITHTYQGDLRVTLISPGGLQLVIHDQTGGGTPNLVITDMPITAFDGMAAAGPWQLLVQDLASADVGTLSSWSLAFTGSCTDLPANWSGSASPNLPTINSGSVCSTLTVTGTGEASDAKLDIRGRHDHRSVLRGRLTHNGVTVVAFPVKTFPATSGIFQFVNRPISGLTGSATGPWTMCVDDTDGFGDTGIFNSWSVHN